MADVGADPRAEGTGNGRGPMPGDAVEGPGTVLALVDVAQEGDVGDVPALERVGAGHTPSPDERDEDGERADAGEQGYVGVHVRPRSGSCVG